jgi:hypothetical protein
LRGAVLPSWLDQAELRASRPSPFERERHHEQQARVARARAERIRRRRGAQRAADLGRLGPPARSSGAAAAPGASAAGLVGESGMCRGSGSGERRLESRGSNVGSSALIRASSGGWWRTSPVNDRDARSNIMCATSSV